MFRELLTRWGAVSPTRLAVALLTCVTLFRFWFSTRMQLVGDEAYYWLWSKHLAASYRDKGPAIAWTIALGTKIFGDTVFGIRFFAVLCGAAVGFLLFALARRMYDERTALWCLLMALLMPMMAVGSILMTIDSLSLLSWALASLLFWNALQRDRLLDWVWIGLVIGLGFLAKFTNGVQLACIGLFLLLSREHRRLLVSRKFAALIGAFLLSILPLIWWNISTGWVHATALRSRSGVEKSFGIHPFELVHFVGEVFGVVSPLFMAAMGVAAVVLFWTRATERRTLFLLSQSLPVFAIFLFFSLNKSGKSNWIAPALITGIIFTVAYWRERITNCPVWRWPARAAFAMAGVMTLAVHNTDYLHFPRKLDPLRRAQGWDDFARHVQAARVKHQANLLIGSHYMEASLMAFYLPDQPETFMLPEEYGASQFSLWPGYKRDRQTRAIYVCKAGRSLPPALASEFHSVTLLDQFWSTHKGRPMSEFRIYLCLPD